MLRRALGLLDLPVEGQSAEDIQIAVQIIHLLTATLEGSPSNRQSFLQVQGQCLCSSLRMP